MKKFGFAVTLLLVLVCVLSLFSSLETANGQEEIKVICDNKTLKFNAQPRIINNYVFVPFRSVFEALDAQVTWDEKSGTVKAVSEQSILVINLHENTASINGNNVTLSPAPIMENGQTLLPLRFVSEALYARVSWEGDTKTVFIEKNKLPVVGSYQNLKKILEPSEIKRNETYQLAKTAEMSRTSNQVTAGAADIAGAPAAADQAVSESKQSKISDDYSTTNIQVEGVDEGDIIKTDGKYIYQVNNNRVVITLAAPAEKMAVTDIIKFTPGEFSPQELYVDDKHLVVIGSSYENRPMDEPMISEKVKIYPPVRRSQTVKAIIYDISDKNDIKEIREVELEGSYISSRKVGSLIYLTANKYLDYYQILKGEEFGAVPFYRDSIQKDTDIKIPYEDICYFPGRLEPNYLLTAGLDLDLPDQEMKVSAYLGAGENIYATENSLYAAVSGYENQNTEGVSAKLNTLVYKFTLNLGEVKYAAQGEVPGTILNQFSMDEHKGFFRIATTTGETWWGGDTSKNNIYILDEKMKLTGKIEDIAPGERIYSVRFMGDRGYLVTFKNVDPLFVIDLKDPQEPKILGALKIPGYSDYLHPYDENHIIGFGKDTVELSQKDGLGKEVGTMAFYQGMKIALFDVSDVNHPVQKFQEIIGDRGTDSELLRNHKALLFSREKNLMAFPVTVMEIKNKNQNQSNFTDYGEFTFQGAYVYQLDLAKGLILKGTITHLDREDQLKAGLHWYPNTKNIERIIYIGDVLYTLSPGMIKAHNLNNLTEIMSLDIPQ
ncbi:MAG: beta-propeller domain-containing protein [Bacillota bacterium]